MFAFSRIRTRGCLWEENMEIDSFDAFKVLRQEVNKLLVFHQTGLQIGCTWSPLPSLRSERSGLVGEPTAGTEGAFAFVKHTFHLYYFFCHFLNVE